MELTYAAIWPRRQDQARAPKHPFYVVQNPVAWFRKELWASRGEAGKACRGVQWVEEGGSWAAAQKHTKPASPTRRAGTPCRQTSRTGNAAAVHAPTPLAGLPEQLPPPLPPTREELPPPAHHRLLRCPNPRDHRWRRNRSEAPRLRTRAMGSLGPSSERSRCCATDLACRGVRRGPPTTPASTARVVKKATDGRGKPAWRTIRASRVSSLHAWLNLRGFWYSSCRHRLIAARHRELFVSLMGRQKVLPYHLAMFPDLVGSILVLKHTGSPSPIWECSRTERR